MMNVDYYQHSSIMKRILEHVDNAVYVLGTEPHEPSTQFRRHSDIMNAMGKGSDIYRSQIDFGGVNFFIDVEYGNRVFPGEIFHKPFETFEKIEGLRKAIKHYLEEKGISTLELMTGQGYNYTSKIKRDSASYKALSQLGQSLKILPWSAAKRLMEKEERHGNIPLLEDSFVFGALGKITEHIHEQLKKEYNNLPLETSDIFDNDEIAIFDTTQYGYYIYKRWNRIAFSLHQKSAKKPELGYRGPPISTITPNGLSLENRIMIRSDESNNYSRAAELANEARTTIPEVDISYLITSYLLSETYDAHRKHSQRLPEKKLNNAEAIIVNAHYPNIEYEGIFWEVSKEPDWKIINSVPISRHARTTINNPNDLLLKPWDIRHLIRELQRNDVPLNDIISLISFKYAEPHHKWSSDMTKNNPDTRAEYWVRTLMEK